MSIYLNTTSSSLFMQFYVQGYSRVGPLHRLGRRRKFVMYPGHLLLFAEFHCPQHESKNRTLLHSKVRPPTQRDFQANIAFRPCPAFMRGRSLA